MSFDDWIKVIDALKWPLAAIAVAALLFFVLRTEIRGLVSGLRARSIRYGGAEAGPEQQQQFAPVAAGTAVAAALIPDAPHPFELSDNAYFRSQVQALTQRVQAINFASPEERHRWLMREGAGLTVRLDFETIHLNIWASQMELLGVANRLPGVPEEIARQHYAAAAERAPLIYANYPFENWIGFPIGYGLATVNDGVLKTTEKGKLFIQYLVSQQYDLHGLYRDR